MHQYIPFLPSVIIRLCLILYFFGIIGSSRKIIHCHFIICDIRIFFHNDRIFSVGRIYSKACVIIGLGNGRTLTIAGFFGNIHKSLRNFYKPYIILAGNFTLVYNSVFANCENILRVVNGYIISVGVLNTAVNCGNLPYNIIAVADAAEYKETVAVCFDKHKLICIFAVRSVVKTKFHSRKRRSLIIHSLTHDNSRLIAFTILVIISFYLYFGVCDLCISVNRIVKFYIILFFRLFITFGSTCLLNKIFSVLHIFKYEESVIIS